MGPIVSCCLRTHLSRCLLNHACARAHDFMNQQWSAAYRWLLSAANRNEARSWAQDGLNMLQALSCVHTLPWILCSAAAFANLPSMLPVRVGIEWSMHQEGCTDAHRLPLEGPNTSDLFWETGTFRRLRRQDIRIYLFSFIFNVFLLDNRAINFRTRREGLLLSSKNSGQCSFHNFIIIHLIGLIVVLCTS